MKIKNARTIPKVYFGLHMSEGVAEYREPGSTPYRIFIGETAIKNMDPTFAGRPVYVQHVDDVNLDKLQEEADGYVVESFFNKSDGKHWVKFLVVSDRGHEAVAKGWKLSNCYLPKMFSAGGQWHGVDYSKEVTAGEYEHLAIVPNPRYEESVIMSPEQFKKYNGEKEQELLRLANAKKQGVKSMFEWFKRAKVENASEFEGISIVLPKSKKEKTLTQIVNELDSHEMAMMGPEHMANGEHMVECGGEKMSVNALVEKHLAMANELAELKKNAAPPEMSDEEKAKKAEADKKANDDAEAAKKAEEEKKANEAAEAKKKEDEEKQKNALHFESLKNANLQPLQPETKIELSVDRVARGQSKYGSN